MKNTSDVKERMIRATSSLITNGEGNIEDITTRMIAEKANIGIGLINYHFQSKDHLIEICVQRMIQNVISNYQSGHISDDVATQLKHTAKLVMDFLIDNPSVSRISILGDYKNPQIGDNTMGTIKGFFRSYGRCGAPKGKELIMLFALTSTMSSMFLRKDISKEIFDIDVYHKCERDLFIDYLIDILFAGFINQSDKTGCGL